MFGYIKTDKFEMRYKDAIMYKKLYCAVCNSLKDNLGLKGRLLTSYDATLFLAIFDAIDTSPQITYFLSCPFNLFKSKSNNVTISKAALHYTAYISTIYSYTKLKDNVHDECKLKDKIKYRKFTNNNRCNALLCSYSQLTELLTDLSNNFYKLEKSKNPDFDNLSNNIGRLFGEAFKGYCNITDLSTDETTLYNIGFNLGKWIYLADAFDDLTDDIKKNNFNPLMIDDDYKDFIQLCDKVIFMSNCIIQNLRFQLSQININRNKEVINNIINFGMNCTIMNIADKRYRYMELKKGKYNE